MLDRHLHLSLGKSRTSAIRVLLAATTVSAQFKRNAVLILACQFNTDSIHVWYRCTDSQSYALNHICKTGDNIHDGYLVVLLMWFRAERVCFESEWSVQSVNKVNWSGSFDWYSKWIRGGSSTWTARQQQSQGMIRSQAFVGSKLW